MTKPFAIKRLDGRSNTRVIIDLVRDTEPDTLFSFSKLAEVLERGTSTVFDHARIGAAVRGASRRLLREHQRTLQSVATVGYRLAKASDHAPLAVMRQGRANRQMQHAWSLLENVKWDEMDANTRTAHQAQLILTSQVAQQLGRVAKQQAKASDAISALIRRVDDLEAQQAG